jgi:hypothetical protein
MDSPFLLKEEIQIGYFNNRKILSVSFQYVRPLKGAEMGIRYSICGASRPFAGFLTLNVFHLMYFSVRLLVVVSF